MLVMSSRPQRYNSNTFGIPARGSLTPVQQDTGIIPEAHKNYLVYNMGRTEVHAALKYGTKVMWHGIADEATIKPGERRTLNNGGRPYYVTAVKIYNNTNERAVVHCSYAPGTYVLYADKEPGTFDEVRNKILKNIFALGVKYIPYVGSGLSAMVKTFWPSNKPNVWEEVQDKVQTLVNQRVMETIAGILSGDIKRYQDRISALADEMDKGGSPQALRVHYMNIAQDLVGLEKKFMFGREMPDYREVNQYILPHFSTTVLMKISFYVIGINNRIRLGLDDENVRNITGYANRTLDGNDGANKYIEDMYKERLDHTYTTAYAEDLYDNMMNVRSYIGTQGFEYMRLWNHLIRNLSERGLYNDIISYSTFFGRQTPNLISRGITEEYSEPLTPSLVNGKRNRIRTIDFYMWRNTGGPRRIGGMRVNFENNRTYTLGTVSNDVQAVAFNGALLNKLEVWGGGAIDHLVFHFSDRRVVTVGERAIHNQHTIFELPDHHIVGFFLATDNFSLAGQAANFSVAYQLVEK